MSLTTRVLPVEEWPRLSRTDLPAVLPYVRAADTQVVVVEHGDQIVGCWAVMRVTHLEGLWIDPAYRGRVGVARRLWCATRAVARAVADRWVWTGSQTPEIAAMLTKAGAVQIPMDTFVLPIHGDTSCQLPQSA